MAGRQPPNGYDHNTKEIAHVRPRSPQRRTHRILTKQAVDQGTTHAAIIALIGAIAHTYSSYPFPAEMTATGEIIDETPTSTP
ncbi:MAG TPA: hypothetical protein VGO16_00375 [Pseudonocardiaceae bacterium]|jgi:hypothetical protein|nr:hypothetical protein [Pseudonocardiaceae bacterium]